jgi:uncharacterized protein (DUF58 family)
MMFNRKTAKTLTALSDEADGLVHVSLKSLIAQRHAAASLPLKAARIRAPGAGEYRTSFKGRGMEFDEVRAYTPGDDARTLDWRVTARTGRPHTKLFREERERPVLLWVDMRSSMFFATKGAYKAVRAAQAAALIGWSAIHGKDKLGGLIFSGNSHVEFRPGRGKMALLHLLQHLVSLFARDNTRSEPEAFNHALARLLVVAQPGSLIVLISDFAGLDQQSHLQLAQLSRHNELLLLDIHDPIEKELPPAGHYRVSDGTNFMSLFTSDTKQREAYRARFMQQLQMLQHLCIRYRMTLLSLDTTDEPLKVLQRALQS